MSNKVSIQRRLSSRNHQQLPIQHFVVTQDWIPKLTEKIYCAWLNLYTYTYTSPYEDDPENDYVPHTSKQLMKLLGVELEGFRYIIQTLWEYELIEFEQHSDENIKVIVYPYPKNKFELSIQPLQKTRDFQEEGKHLLPVFDENNLPSEVVEWVSLNSYKIDRRAKVIGKYDVRVDDIHYMYRKTKGHITVKEFILTLDALVTRYFNEIIDFEKEFRQTYITFVRENTKEHYHKVLVDWMKDNQQRINKRTNVIGENDIRLARIEECYNHFSETVPLHQFLEVLDSLLHEPKPIVDFLKTFRKCHQHLADLGDSIDARDDGSLDTMKDIQKAAQVKKAEEWQKKNPELKRRQLILGQAQQQGYDEEDNMSEEELQKLREEGKKAMKELLEGDDS